MSEWINFYSPWNRQKSYGFLTISEGVEINEFSSRNSRIEICRWSLNNIQKYQYSQESYISEMERAPSSAYFGAVMTQL